MNYIDITAGHGLDDVGDGDDDVSITNAGYQQ